MFHCNFRFASVYGLVAPVLVLCLLQVSCQSGEQLELPSTTNRNAALLEYADKGDVQGIAHCLDLGADPNFDPVVELGDDVLFLPARFSEKSKTPLINAARNGHLEAVRLLLKRGALPNVRTTDETPLHAAALRGHAPVVRQLLAAGANVYARVGRFGSDDALSAARRGGYESVVFVLYLEGAHVEQRDLCYAVEEGHAKLVREYLTIGLDPRAKACWDGLSALDRARRLPPSAERDEILRSLTTAAAGPPK